MREFLSNRALGTGESNTPEAEKEQLDVGELGSLEISSCIMSRILESMLNARFARTREYASRIE